MNRERPGAIVRVSVAVRVPSKLVKRALTVVFAAPKFCMTKVVTHARLQFASVGGHGAESGFPTNGRYTLVAPLVRPLYERASARAGSPAPGKP